jgi:hypothetical protein
MIMILGLAPTLLALSFLLPSATAHFAAWHKGEKTRYCGTKSSSFTLRIGMYCLNGTRAGFDDQNTNSIANPLFNVVLSHLISALP